MNQPNLSSRKKFLIWGAAALASIAAFRLRGGKAEKQKNGTVRMLTQDGRLVEVDRSMLSSSASKITDKDLQNWVTNKPLKSIP